MIKKLNLMLFLNKKCLKTYLKCFIFLFLQTACIIIVPVLMTYLSSLTSTNSKVDIFSWLSRDNQLIAISLLLILLSICLLVFGLFANYYSVKFSKEVVLNIRTITYSNIQTFSSLEIEKFGQSSIINRLIIDVNNLATAIESFCRMLVQSILIYIGGIIGLIALTVMPDPNTAKVVTTSNTIPSYAIVLIVLLITIVLIFVIFLISRLSYKGFMNTQKKLDEINFIAQEDVLGQKSVKSFVIQDTQNDRFISKNEQLKYWGTKTGLITAWILPSIYFFLDISMVIALWLTNKDLVDKIMSIFLLIGIIMVALINSISAMVQFNRAIPSWLRVVEIATYKSEMNYSETEAKLGNDNSIEIKNLTFNYPNVKKPTLEKINLKIKSNEFIGIIGPTGSGKSTLVNLIMHLQDPTSGEIRLRDTDIKKFTKHQIRSNIAYCPQDVILFEGTVKSNILFGNRDANEKEIMQAIENAGLYDFVMSKKEKLDYPVAQRGKNLSGGQKQRLSLARALVKKTPFLILDDATSSIDMLTEKLICENLVKNQSNQTIILVSQRVTALKNANRIIVIDGGKIIGFDTHKNLLKNCKYYRDIAISQLGEKEVKNALN